MPVVRGVARTVVRNAEVRVVQGADLKAVQAVAMVEPPTAAVFAAAAARAVSSRLQDWPARLVLVPGARLARPPAAVAVARRVPVAAADRAAATPVRAVSG